MDQLQAAGTDQSQPGANILLAADLCHVWLRPQSH